MKIYTSEVKIEHLEREIARLNLEERRKKLEEVKDYGTTTTTQADTTFNQWK